MSPISPFSSKNSSPASSANSQDLPLSALRSPPHLLNPSNLVPTTIAPSTNELPPSTLPRPSLLKKRFNRQHPSNKLGTTVTSSKSLALEEQENGSLWQTQWEQIKVVMKQGWSYLFKQWKKTRISKGVIDYWTMHMIYLFFLGLTGSVIIFIGENSKKLGGAEFIDCFFLAVSAITGTGLTILPFTTSSRVTTMTCYVLMTIGSSIMLSIPPVLLRRYLYRQAHSMEFETPDSTPNNPSANLVKMENETAFEFTGRKMYQAMSETVSKFTPYMNEFKKLGSLSSLSNEEMNVNISSKTEYHAAGLLLRLYIFYIMGIQIIGFLVIGSYAQFHPPTRTLLQASNLNPWSWSLFHVSSCFYNAGFSLIPESLKHLYNESVIIVTSIMLAIFGNCLFPITLRWIIILMSKSRLFSKKTKKCTSFLIKHPRRASIHLFQDRETWILLLSWIAGNIIQVAFSLAFDMQRLPFLPFTQLKQVGIFFFQAFSNRTSGFYIVDLNLYSKVAQVIWIFIIFMDSYPLLLTIKHTGSSSEKKKEEAKRLSEKKEGTGLEKELEGPVATGTISPPLYLANKNNEFISSGLVSDRLATENASLFPPVSIQTNVLEPNANSLLKEECAKDTFGSPNPLTLISPTHPQFLSQSNDDNEHLLKQWVLRDVCCIYCFLLLILVAETPWSEAGEPTDGLKLDIWVALFEVISAYSTVGLSLDNLDNVSLCSKFSSFSKLVLILTMLLGRTRSVPSTIDYSFAPQENQAPKEQLFILSSAREDEEEDLLSEDDEEAGEGNENAKEETENNNELFETNVLDKEEMKNSE